MSMKQSRTMLAIAAAALFFGTPAWADLSISNRTLSELTVDIYNQSDGLMAITCRTMTIRAGQAWAVNPNNSTNCAIYSHLKIKVWADVGNLAARSPPCWGYSLDWKSNVTVTVTASVDETQLSCSTN
jgi:hypothetical protein